MKPTVPSPIPPWARPVQSPTIQTLTGDGVIDLGPDVTYLSQTEDSADGKPYQISIPDGNYRRQMKRIYIPGEVSQETAEFQIVGHFTKCESFMMNDAATSLFLEWDGTSWQKAGGDAQESSTEAQPAE